MYWAKSPKGAAPRRGVGRRSRPLPRDWTTAAEAYDLAVFWIGAELSEAGAQE
jgi:hypothetical protein